MSCVSEMFLMDNSSVYDIYTGLKLDEEQVRAGRETEVKRMLEAAMRRRQRRLRQFLRHEHLSVAMALAENLHHTSRGQRFARAGEEGREEHYAYDDRSPLLPSRSSSACSRKSPAVPGHPAWVSRGGHSSGSSRTSWSSLPTSCPWFRSWICLWRKGRRGGAGGGPGGGLCFSTSTSRSLSRLSKCPRSQSHPVVVSCLSSAFVPMEHQTAEQLVEVPTTISLSSLQRTVEQSVDIPGTGRRPGGGGGLQSLRPGQDSTAFGGAEHVDNPVPQGRGGGRGLHGLRPGQGSSASASSSMDRSYVAEGAFDGFFRTFPSVKESAGSASQCGDHPLGYFSPSAIVAHSSSWTPAAYGQGTLPIEDDG